MTEESQEWHESERFVAVVAGARPNFMKVAPILHVMEERDLPWSFELVHTGQHYDEAMNDVFFRQLSIRRPDVHLEVGSGKHGEQTARVLERFEAYIVGHAKPCAGVIVVGDVNSTLACTLAAAKLHVPVAHVEAGLRSGDRAMPEEINRLMTDAVADLLFVSEPAGLENLAREGVSEDRIVYVGNVMIDTLVDELREARRLEMAMELGLGGVEYAYVTIHRPSNVDDRQRLINVVEYLTWLADRVPVVFPVHPRTASRLDAAELRRSLEQHGRIKLLEPLGYRESLSLMSSARLVVTDSGGIQEETTYLKIPCLTLRSNTERPITLTEGTNVLVGQDLELAREMARKVLAGEWKRGGDVRGWDGHAARRIVGALAQAWGDSAEAASSAAS